jgi:peptidyl-prolyl cis-trans isomerase C
MRKGCFFLVFFFVLFLKGCGPWGGGLPEGNVARVDEETISVEEFDREFRELVLEPGKEAPEKPLADLKKVYLDQMIERKLLVLEARKRGVKVSPTELNQALSEIRNDYAERELGARLGSKGMTLESWKARMEEKLLAEKMIRSVSQYQGKIDDKEAAEYYERHRSRFQLPQKVRVRQIVVADGEEAIQILKRLKKGEKFEKLASEKSLGPEKANGGDLGYFGQGEKPPEFDHVFAMEAGTISEVIKSPYGYHIFKVVEKIDPRDVPFEEARASILRELSKKKGEEEYHKWLDGLKRKAKVIVNKRLLQS